MPDDGWTRRVNISNGREIFVVPMLTVENVMRMLVCSRSSAYEHMNRALGRTERPGRLLRVPLDVLELHRSYAQARSILGSTVGAERRTVGVHSYSSSAIFD